MTSSSSTTPKAPLAVYGGIAVCSAAVLMQEIILTRVFSFTIWYHLAYLTISTALLGFGAAGSLLAGVGWLGRISGRTLSAWGAAGAAVSLLVSAVILGPRPLDPLELVTHPASFSLGLLGYYIVITLPFLFAGLAIVSPLRAFPDEVNRLYAADLFGAGLGCLGAVLSLKFAPAPVAIILCALLFATSAVLYAVRDRQALACAVLTATILAISPLYARYLTFMPAPSKAMGDHIRRPGTVIEYTKWSPINRVDVYSMANPHLTFWAGIGRGEGYKGPVPAGLSLQYDAHNGSAIYSNENPDAFELLDTHLLRLPYLLKDAPEVLVIGVGGGIDIYNAFRRGSKHVTAVELQPITVDLLTKNKSIREYTRDYFLRPDLNLVASEGRHYVRAHDDTYDLIQQTATDTFSAQSTGAYVLAESYLYTVEAMTDYLSRLNDDGIITVVIGDLLPLESTSPPPLIGRLSLAAVKALRNTGVSDPAQHIVVVADKLAVASTSESWTAAEPDGETKEKVWTSVVNAIMIKKSAFTEAEIDIIRSYADANGFGVATAPDTPDTLPLSRLVHASPDELTKILSKEVYKLKPVTDDTPFFFHILPWSSVITGERTVWNFPGSTTGQLILIIMLAQALLLGAVMILAPLVGRVRVGDVPLQVALGSTLYFSALGIGFMLIEISFVQKYVLLLGYPTYSLSVTVFSLLVFAGAGAYMSSRFWSHIRRFLGMLVVVTVLLVFVEVSILPAVRDAVLASALWVRILVTVFLQLPLGICLGMYFPTGVELIRGYSPILIPWAWAVNGAASVVSLVLAVILGMNIGFSNVAIVAACVYAVGVFAMLWSLPRDKTGAS